MEQKEELNQKLVVKEGKTGKGEIKTFKYETLNDLNKNAICKIELNNRHGTGFFCKIPSPQNKNDKIKVLFTCYHVLFDDKNDNNYQIVEIFYHIENQGKKALNLNNRKTWSDKDLDYMCIEILEEDNIHDYLNIDENIIQDNYPLNELKKKAIYIFNSKLEFSIGNLLLFFNKNIYYDSETKKGWSGAPIFVKNENNVIAIHQGFNYPYNTGILIRSILKHMNNEKENIPNLTKNEK